MCVHVSNFTGGNAIENSTYKMAAILLQFKYYRIVINLQ